jgi:hypothetical protein
MLFVYYLPRKPVDVFTALHQNHDPVMAVEVPSRRVFRESLCPGSGDDFRAAVDKRRSASSFPWINELDR